jgi:hypothetical protein
VPLASHRTPAGHLGVLAVLACAAVLLAGCRLDLLADAVLEADGSGSVAIEATFDDELLAELEELGVDPTVELEATAAAEGWRTSRTATDAGGLRVTLARDVATPDELGATLRELSDGLRDEDPALLVDIEVAVDDEGAATLEGTGRFRVPATAGATLDGEPVGPSDDELASIVDRAVVSVFRVTLPGTITTHDGDQLQGRTVSWELTPAPRTIAARSAPPGFLATLDLPLVLAGVAVVLLLLGGVLVWSWRRSG